MKWLLTCLYLLLGIGQAGRSHSARIVIVSPQLRPGRAPAGANWLPALDPLAQPAEHEHLRWTKQPSRTKQGLASAVPTAQYRTAEAKAVQAAQEQRVVRELTQRTRLQQLEAHQLRQYLGGLALLSLTLLAGLLALGRVCWRLRSQRAELAVTRAEQDRLYGLIAHDLRSPVLAFSGLADLLTSYVERQDTARLLGLGGRVRQAADGLRELLDNLLNWSLSQRGELLPALEPVPIASLLVELGHLYQPTADLAGIDLLLATADTSQVLADRQMTLTILRNLLSNAFNATPVGGRITVRAMATGTNWLLLEVADTGQGMSAAELTHLMTSSLLHTTARYRGRAGLGLRLSRSFAQAQGGQLALYSTVGLGTTATLTLPCPSSLAVLPIC